MDAYVRQIVQGDFYKDLVIEMKSGLNEVYETLHDFKRTLGDIHISTQDADLAFQEASDQLDAIFRSTEQATNRIMDITEKNQARLVEMTAMAEGLSAGPERERLLHLLEEAGNDLLGVVTACSFQDITGQRIRKVVTAIQTVEERLLELLVRAGVKMKGKELGKDDAAIEADTRKAIGRLHGPQENPSQDAVDSFLEELGL